MTASKVRNASGTLINEYFIKDHQGNVRVSFEDNGGTALVRQENSFYPFGLTMPGSALPSADNKKLYNGGSEWQNDFADLPDLQQTFYRNYDPALGRFVGVDPVSESAESMTTYQYSADNPVMFNDPFGDQYAQNQEAFHGGYRRISALSGNNWVNGIERGDYNIWTGSESFRNDYNNGNNGLTIINGELYGYNGNGGFSRVTQKNVYWGYWGPTTGRVEASKDENDLSTIHLTSKWHKIAVSNNSESIWSAIWNSTLARYVVPDIITFNAGITFVGFAGKGYNVSINLMTRGKDAGLHFLETGSTRAGLHLDASLNFSAGYFLGDPRKATLNSFMGNGYDATADLEAVGIGLWTSGDKLLNPSWLGYSLGVGPGDGASVGKTNTTFIGKQ